MAISLLPTFSPYTSVIYLRNHKPLIDQVTLQSDTDLSDLTLSVNYFPDYVETQTCNIPELKAGTPEIIRPSEPRYELSRLSNITEEEPGQMTLVLSHGSEEILRQSINFTWLPGNAWVTGKMLQHPELLAALVQPNDPAVDRILYLAGQELLNHGLNPSWTGYGAAKNEIINKLRAIWRVLSAYGINYALPPKGKTDAEVGLMQKIRTPSQIIRGGCATCMDSTMLMAAVVAQAGYNPIVITTRAHAFIGIMLKDEGLNRAVTESVSRLRNLMELGELLVLETTALGRSEKGATSFDEAKLIAEAKLSSCDDFELAYDITQIWSQGIQPINSIQEELTENVLSEKLPEDKDAKYLPEQTAADLEEEESLVSSRKRTRMENWQLKLLDLSMRNNLLNCRVDRNQISIFPYPPARLEDDLANGKSFRIAELQPNFAIDEAIKAENHALVNELISKQAEEMYNKGELLAFNLSKTSTLDKRTHALYLAARRNLEESGYNTLYITCGFLKWIRRDKGKQELMAPLLLIPVKLTRKSVKSGFRLQTTDEEPRINLTLLELLKTEYNLRIPELEGDLPTDQSGLDINAIFRIVRRAIQDFNGWEVSEMCSIGIFSFAKYLMWKDMCDRQADLMTNPIVSHLSAEQRATFPAQVDFPDPSELDNEADAHQVYTPLSSDSSQLSAILAAGQGKNFVLIGPPGTGKSQTISNMIAHCLGHGKTVLFVAEKSAALSVVYNRLKRIGLGDFCLELHSNKSVKKEVLAQFKTALDSIGAADSPDKWEQVVTDLLNIRFGLNLMPWELHRTYPDGGSLYHDICRVIEEPDIIEFTPCEDSALTMSAERRKEISDQIQTLTLHYQAVEKLYPGVAEGIVTRSYSSVWEEKLTAALSRFAQTSSTHDDLFEQLCVHLGLQAMEYRSCADALLSLLTIAEETTGQDNTPLLPATAEVALASLQQAFEQAQTYRRAKAALSLPYPEGLEMDPSIPMLYQEWKMAQLSNFISRFFINRRIRKTLQMHAFTRTAPDIRHDLENLLAMKAATESDVWKNPELAHFRKGTAMEPADIDKARNIAASLASLRGVTALAKRYLSIAGNPVQKGTETAFILDELQECAGRKTALSAELAELLGAPLPTIADNQRGAAGWWTDKLLEIRRQWRLITIWNDCAATARSKGLGAVVEQLASGQILPDDLAAAVNVNLSRQRLRSAVDSSRTLTRFNADTHEAHIADFREKDANLLTAAGLHLRQILSKQAARVTEFGRELAELQHEIGKQRAHKAIRKLLSLTPHVSRLLKPCMLMSPLSVAQYLTPDAEPFDVVIFDEASQIPVWDAIGAIGRGKSAIIVGDPRQMPPTSFFSRSRTEGDEEQEEEIEQDLESILDECLACGIPQMNLTWHYRSKAESLIAYSNRNYYENKLVTFPAPVAKDTALQYHYIPGTYERGNRKRYNRKEAQALVDHVLNVLRTPGFRYDEMTSIGIVTFNTQQQALILDLLEKARAEDESLEPYFDEENPEAVFVKNLENVQGDERGVIYFSTTYGPDEKGSISMNFGPLNQTGGERRLNVAITRARTGMRVFSSLKPEDIDLNRTRARGAADLRGFLECARMGANAYFNRTGNAGSTADKGLQQAICDALRNFGWNCVSNLGVSGFRVDIAIAHPKQPGNMLAGIVLDGPTYASAATARDRDVLRESVLKSLGWNIFHIWSLDWWRDPLNYAEKIHNELSAL